MSKEKPLYRVIVEPGGGHGQYPKYEKFWHIEKWDSKNKRYFRTGSDGLHVIKWFMWRAIRKELKKLNAGYQAEHYTINGVRID